MKSLSRTDKQQYEQLSNELERLQFAVTGAIKIYNEDPTEENWANIQPQVEQFNDVVNRTNTFIEETHGTLDEYYDSKSEKWQEGETGEQFYEWVQAWEDIELDIIQVNRIAVGAKVEDLDIDLEVFQELPLNREDV